jgi:hypothetical protein
MTPPLRQDMQMIRMLDASCLLMHVRLNQDGSAEKSLGVSSFAYRNA